MNISICTRRMPGIHPPAWTVPGLRRGARQYVDPCASRECAAEAARKLGVSRKTALRGLLHQRREGVHPFHLAVLQLEHVERPDRNEAAVLHGHANVALRYHDIALLRHPGDLNSKSSGPRRIGDALEESGLTLNR